MRRCLPEAKIAVTLVEMENESQSVEDTGTIEENFERVAETLEKEWQRCAAEEVPLTLLRLLIGAPCALRPFSGGVVSVHCCGPRVPLL